jgi:hypothetical protein
MDKLAAKRKEELKKEGKDEEEERPSAPRMGMGMGAMMGGVNLFAGVGGDPLAALKKKKAAAGGGGHNRSVSSPTGGVSSETKKPSAIAAKMGGFNPLAGMAGGIGGAIGGLKKTLTKQEEEEERLKKAKAAEAERIANNKIAEAERAAQLAREKAAREGKGSATAAAPAGDGKPSERPENIKLLANLKAGIVPEGVDSKKKIDALPADLFAELFKVSREEFDKQPSWKQENQKKRMGLF